MSIDQGMYRAVADERDYYRTQRDRWRDKANTQDLVEMTRVAWLEHDLREAREQIVRAEAVLREIVAANPQESLSLRGAESWRIARAYFEETA